MNYPTVRNRFLQYFNQLDYATLSRAPMLHPSIPMSFVMSAGLVQVESGLYSGEVMMGDKYVLIQDCFRHFDQKRVQSGQNHLSLFEMSGAFEFGDVQRSHDLEKIWKFVTEILEIDRSRIWVTYFAGDRIGQETMPADRDSYDCWKSLGIEEHRIVGLSKSDNFWIQGGNLKDGHLESRKCGPNSEIFFDKGAQYACGEQCKPGCRCGRFIEFANILFIQYELFEHSQSLRKLSIPFVESVIGNERVAMVIQEKQSVFDIDSYAYLRKELVSFVDETSLPQIVFKRNMNTIIAHLRALYILVSDGAPPPGRGGRAHIIKGLIRAVVARLIILDIPHNPFLDYTLDKIIAIFGESIDYRSGGKSKIIDYFEMDADRFAKTLKRGQRHILRFIKDNSASNLSKSQIQFFEKQLGVPRIIIHKIAKENGIYIGAV